MYNIPEKCNYLKIPGGFSMRKNRYFINILIVVLVLSMIILPLISAAVSADGETMLVFDFINGMEETRDIKTIFNKDITITGNALENTKIKVNIYWNKPINEKSIIAKEKSWEFDYGSEDWILQKTLDHTVGASKTFALPAKIKIGKYKVEVIAKKADDIISYEMEIEYIDKNEIIEELNNKMFKGINLGTE